MFFKIIYLILIAQVNSIDASTQWATVALIFPFAHSNQVQIDGQSSIPDPSQIIDMPSNSSLIATITNTCSGLELIMVAINAAIQHAICTGIEILELLNKLPQNVAKQIGRTITSLQSLANALDKLITLLPFLGSVQQCNQQLIGQLKQAQTDSNAKVNAISKIFVEINTRIEAQAMSPKCLLEVTQLKANIQSEFNKNIFNCVNMYSSQASSILSGSLNKVTSLVATILPLISAKRLVNQLLGERTVPEYCVICILF